MPKSIKKLQQEIADHLGIDPLPIKFEDIGLDDYKDYGCRSEYNAEKVKRC